MRSIVMINVTGPDKPGVTSALTGLMAQYDVNILDIGQSNIHECLNLSLVLDVPNTNEPILRDILFKSYELGLQVRAIPIEEEAYEHWVGQQGKPRHIVTVLGTRLTALHISRISGIIARNGLNIDVITRLSGRVSFRIGNRTPRACVEFSVRGAPKDLHGMRAEFLAASQELGIDVALQADNMFRRTRRLVCCDMDSTLIQAEVIVELADYAGVRTEVDRITEAAMRGELEFKESLRRRLALLRGLDVSVMQRIAERLPLTDGAEKMMTTLKQLGYKTAIISGGFTFFGNYLKAKLGCDYVFANELEIADGRLTGNVVGEIVDGPRKAEILKMLAEKEGICLQQVIAIGDGANDLPMLDIAGLGIAFHAKPMVKEKAAHALSSIGLDGVLYLLGLRDRETGK